MVSALLIVFEYWNNTRYTNLPGALLDLYSALEYAEYICGNKSKIKIITDISSVRFPQFVEEAITNCYIRSSSRDKLEEYCQNIIQVRDRLGFLEALQTYQKDEASFVYYSGHARNSDIILPNSDRENFCSIANILQGMSLVVLDCCYPHTMGCNFIWKNGKFEVLANKICQNSMNPEIILITASSKTQVATTYDTGSKFTRLLCNILSRNKILKFSDITKLSSFLLEQSVTVYASRDFPIFWTWISLTPGLYTDNTLRCIAL